MVRLLYNSNSILNNELRSLFSCNLLRFNNWQGLIGKFNSWTPDGCMWILEIRANQVINFIRSGDEVTFPGVTLPVGEWAHVAVTFDGTIQVFYINGEEVGRSEWSLCPGTDAGMRFGCDRPNGSNPFHSALDEVMLYNWALSDLEVLELVSNE